ncbi:MAG: SpvB/TcaC N-terminal domain-containing protein [Candidatus Aminicenantes bacterium]|jgi:RHS repeat-associated protein
MEQDAEISTPTITLPEGGGTLKGIGDSFQPNLFDGTAGFSIPVFTSQSRGFQPQFSVTYNSNRGNSVFGKGFDINIPNISRKTAKGIPRYDDFDEDTFLLSNSEDLVPYLVEKDGEWENDEKEVTADSAIYSVKRYRPRIEGIFAKIEKWKNLESNEIHWQVTTKDNITNIYGKTSQARIADPGNELKVFTWLLEESSDAKGNRIYYEYKQEDDAGTARDLAEVNRCHTANRYLKKIKYGNYLNEEGEESFAFLVIFDYGEHDLDNWPHLETKEWDKRQDSFSSYRSGFEIRTHRLCRQVLMFHQFRELGDEPCLVRTTGFDYDETPAASYLKSVRQTGYKKTGDTYDTAEIPPLEFIYSEYDLLAQNFTPLELEKGNSIPGLVDQAQYTMIDLYGEGIPGILYNDETSVLYWRGRGEGNFDGPETVYCFPNERKNNAYAVQYSLQDLEVEGRLDLVVNDPRRPGFYEMNHEGTWENFRTFESFPMTSPEKETRQVDINGDGQADILMMDNGSISYHLSKGKKGYDSLVRLLREADEDHIPTVNRASAEEVFRFADMFGDGLSHPVRIRDGIVECWPNMGYGKFGKKITLKNSPQPEGKLEPSRLYLADIDGSGTTDLVYLYHDRVELYLNQSGNGFSEPQTIDLFEPIDNLDRVNFADVLGNGTTCMVVSRQAAGSLAVKHEYYDFTGGIKPGLVVEMVNNMGAAINITYASSSKFYLEDQANNTPWATKLSFPVRVVEKTAIKDLVSGTSLTTTYKYHHGYYDTVEREFRGFGLVEQWDAEVFNENNDQGEEEKEYVPPVYTKTWHHTGAYVMEGIFSRQFAAEYYSKDENAYHLPDTRIDANGENLDAGEIREAHRAMKGMVLRSEVYAQDQIEGVSQHPYTVSEANAVIRLVQPRQGNKNAVFMVIPRENLTYYYERNPDDPRISHGFTLEVDEYGNVLKRCDLVYPRRDSDSASQTIYPRQQQIKATLTCSDVINTTGDFYLLGVLYQGKSFEIGGLELLETNYFETDQLGVQVEEALQEENLVSNEAVLDNESLQARLLEWTRHYYWDENQENALELGHITAQALLHHRETAQFSENQAISLYGEKVENVTSLMEEAGYHSKDSYWWQPGLTQYYGSAQAFYLPTHTEDTFGYRTEVSYDDYHMALIQSRDELGNTVNAQLDYMTLQAWKLTDINDNVSEALFNPLGMVRAISVYGTVEGEQRGDSPLSEYSVKSVGGLEDILNDPHSYLQETTGFFYYDYAAWQEREEAPYFISLNRVTHTSDLDEDEETEVQIRLGYSDGFGRDLQQKMKVEPGMAFARDEEGNLKYQDGEPVLEEVENRWLSSGRTVFNNKGKPIKQYEPFFSSTPHYETEKEVVEYGVTAVLHYDPLLRVIKTDTPKGFFSKVEFTPWEVKTYDENDTVKDSQYYQATINNEEDENSHRGHRGHREYPHSPYSPIPTPDEITALEQAAEHHDTPTITILDNLGREFMVIANRGDVTELITHTELNILGNALKITDPRQYQLNQSRSDEEQVYNFQYTYNMAGEKVYTHSVDAGERWILNNVMGNPLHTWNGRGYHSKTRYDELHRPIEIHVEGNGLDHVVQRREYGEGEAEAKDKNLKGQMIRHYDQAGIVENLLFDFKGQPLHSTRKLRSTYKEEVNWEDIESVALEEEMFETHTVYDALGRIIRHSKPDGSITMPRYHPSGLLNSVEVTLRGETESTTFVKSIEYDARGQRQNITYGNEVITQYAYEETTFRLIQLQTYRESDGKMLQDIAYTYDPVGNITRISDSSHEKIFTANQEVEAVCGFIYDALYQLKEATGREHPGLSKTDYQQDSETFKSTHFAHINDANQLRNYTRQFSYDIAGNLEQIKHVGENSFTRDMIVSGTSNRAITDEMDTGNNPEDYFDAHGNMQELDHLAAVHWNYRDQIGSVDIIERDSENDSEYYVYNGEGQRVRKVKETYNSSGELLQKEEKIYLGGIEIKRVKNGTSETLTEERWTLHVMDDQKRIALVHYWTESNSSNITTGQHQIRYQLDNHLGSVSLELNESGEIISYEEYFPFGGTAFTTGSSAAEVKLKEYRYTGKERDDTTGLYYYGARYYAPWMGRWLNPDPAGTVDGVNLYKYVSNNPLLKSDLNGMEEIIWVYHRTTESVAAGMAGKVPSTELSRRHVWAGKGFYTASSPEIPGYGGFDPGGKNTVMSVPVRAKDIRELDPETAERFMQDTIEAAEARKQLRKGMISDISGKRISQSKYWDDLFKHHMGDPAVIKFKVEGGGYNYVIRRSEGMAGIAEVAGEISETGSFVARGSQLTEIAAEGMKETPSSSRSTSVSKSKPPKRTPSSRIRGSIKLRAFGPSIATAGVTMLLEHNTTRAAMIVLSGDIPTEEEKEIAGIAGYKYEGDRWIYDPTLMQGIRNALLFLLDPQYFFDPPEEIKQTINRNRCTDFEPCTGLI